MKNFTDQAKLIEYLKSFSRQEPILLVIPAISLGVPGLNYEYKDYLDQSASLYKQLTDNDFRLSIFALGAKHRGDGFLHKIGKDYLMKTYNIPESAFAWDDEKFKDIGLCSVEEAELLEQFLSNTTKDYLILTCISKSQLTRYSLHHKGYGIKSIYYVFPDKPDYYHSQSQQQEKILILITKRDPTWKTEAGKKLRWFAHHLRDPKEPEIAQKETLEMQKLSAQFTEK